MSRLHVTPVSGIVDDLETMRAQRMYNPPQAVVAFGRQYTISAGTSDNIAVYHDRESVYVVSENHRLDYIGLEMFDRETGERQFDIFLDSASSDDVDYLLGLSRVPTKIRYMMQWFN